MMRGMEGHASFLHLKKAANTVEVAGSTSYAAGQRLSNLIDGTADGVLVR